MPHSTHEQLDVIAIGAHPDDLEISCGGTLARLVDAGYKVGMIDLTDGEPTPLSPGPEVRLAEAQAAAETLGVQRRITLDLPNRRLFDSFEARCKLAIEFRKYRPRLVIGIGDRTPMASPDHWQAMQIIDAAVFYARLTKWDEHFEHLPVHTIERQLYCMLAQPLSGVPALPGHLLVDISDTLERKIASIKCFQTQFPPTKNQLFARIESMARFLGSTAGVDAAEMLISPRPVVTRDLMQALFN